MESIKVNKDTPLKEIAIADISAIAILSRFGIKPGFGNMTVDEACQRNSISPALFLGVINAYLGFNDPHAELIFPTDNIEATVNFLAQTDFYYEQVQLPNIMRHLKLMLNYSSALNRYISQLAERFRERSDYDRHTLFMMLASPNEYCAEEIAAKGIQLDSDIEEELADLLEYFIVYLETDTNPNMLLGVITAVEALRKDVSGINRIRKQLVSRYLPAEKGDDEKNQTDMLTLREKEVLTLLASGFSNKEVADKLCISANTAITHRRNIVSKLGIRSLAGLSLYAYTHGLIKD